MRQHGVEVPATKATYDMGREKGLQQLREGLTKEKEEREDVVALKNHIRNQQQPVGFLQSPVSD